MTMQQIARDAIMCQDASNGRGIARSLVTAMDTIANQNDGNMSTRAVNQHPAVFMYLYKLMALNGHEPLSMFEQFNEAALACDAIAHAEEIAK